MGGRTTETRERPGPGRRREKQPGPGPGTLARRHHGQLTLVKVTMTGTAEVSNCKNSSSLMLTSGCSSDEAPTPTSTLGMPVLVNAAFITNNRGEKKQGSAWREESDAR